MTTSPERKSCSIPPAPDTIPATPPRHVPQHPHIIPATPSVIPGALPSFPVSLPPFPRPYSSFPRPYSSFPRRRESGRARCYGIFLKCAILRRPPHRPGAEERGARGDEQAAGKEEQEQQAA